MNKAINSKKIMAIVAIIALVAILGVCLAACNSNTVGKKLEGKEYTVVKLNEDSTGYGKTVYDVVKNNSEFKEGLFATKDTDWVAVVWFKSEEEAEKLENNAILKAFNIERSGKAIYVGSKQGVKDAK